ncbi:MAG: hypothetical protein ACRDE6_04745 [Candidatus Limnocylindria bacterium]
MPPAQVRAAFRDLHGARLHGFALLVTLGDRARAARLAAGALTAGGTRLADLRHPERAAAWLRARVLAGAARTGRSQRRRPGVEAMAVLETVGVDAAMLSGLIALTVRERGALVADWIEGLDRRDVATIVAMDGRRLDRLIMQARARYMAVVADAPGALADGPTADRIRRAAARVLA